MKVYGLVREKIDSSFGSSFFFARISRVRNFAFGLDSIIYV